MPKANPEAKLSPWNDVREAELARLSRLGFSASEMALKLNAKFNTTFSRNAVISKRLRSGLCGTRDEAAKRQCRGIVKAVQAEPKLAKNENAILDRVRRLQVMGATLVEETPRDKIAIRPRTILDPLFGGCRWPVGYVEGEISFCCNDRGDLRPYCGNHRRLAFQSMRSEAQVERDRKISKAKKQAHEERQMFKRVNFNE